MIAILCCRIRNSYADWQRKTWISEATCDYKFFFGEGMGRDPLPDEVFVPCPDTYKALPQKTYHLLRYALDHGYDYIFKSDDDIYIRPERLLASRRYDYSGRVYTSYACGLGYWLSSRAAKLVVEAGLPPEGLEDEYVGGIMQQHRIPCIHDPRFQFVYRSGSAMKESWPTAENDVILAGEFPGPRMQEPHDAWRKSWEEFDSVFRNIKL